VQINKTDLNISIMKKITTLVLVSILSRMLIAQNVTQTELPCKMEDLTSPKFKKAVEQAGGVCIIPMGIIEKHGWSAPSAGNRSF
jgi:creatinine amidohydrolase